MECTICYETVHEGEIQVLECAHSLCQICLGRLRSRICPFCRTSIERTTRHADARPGSDEEPYFVFSSELEQAFSVSAAVNRRNRRRRRRRDTPIFPMVGRPVPLSLSQEEVATLRTVQLPALPSIQGSRSRSDNDLQKARRRKARWREGLIHQRSHAGAR